MQARIDYTYLRTKKAAVLQSWDRNEFRKLDTLEVWTGEDATILPLRVYPEDKLGFGRAGVMDADGQYVELSGIRERLQHAYPVQNPEYRDERVIYCGYLVRQWGHFLIEATARLWYVLKNMATTERLIFVTEEDAEYKLKGNYKEFFELLGICDRIEIINRPIRFREVVVPQIGYNRRRFYSEGFKAVFQHISNQIQTPSDWSACDKVYLSRAHLKGIDKRELGNKMLDNYFLNNGYRVVYPEELSLSELILLLRNCKECASISGTLPHNLLFAPDGLKLTIVERNVMNNEIQLDINKLKGLDVTYVDANIALYPVAIGYGPFILAYNDKLEAYTKDRDYQAPDSQYLNKAYMKRCFKAYMNEYRKTYRYQWYMAEWMVPYTDYLFEAYEDGMKYYGEYMRGGTPFRFYHYFIPHYWKQFVKRIVKHIK